jgi:hypothetical protein
MYRERKGVDTHTSIPLDRLGTPQQISSYIKKLIKASQYDFHETEPVVVSKVYLNDTGLQGAINGKFSVSGDEVDEVFPLMPHIQTIPVVGEHVLTSEYNGKLFYFSIINRKNSVNENSIPVDLPTNTKFGKTFTKKDIRHIEVKEGDVVFEGRYGNSINIGCNDANNSPVIKIRTGQTLDSETRQVTGKSVKENIDTDASSIYLTSDGLRDIKFDNQQITGKKILIKSDGIFIKGSDIRLGSGDNNNLQPVVKGNDLKELLDPIFAAQQSVNQAMIAKNTAEIVASSPGGPTPNPQKVVDLTKENKTLAQQNVDLQNAINNSTYLSDKVKTI